MMIGCGFFLILLGGFKFVSLSRRRLPINFITSFTSQVFLQLRIIHLKKQAQLISVKNLRCPAETTKFRLFISVNVILIFNPRFPVGDNEFKSVIIE